MLSHLFDTTGFPPRWRCGIWSDSLGWSHIASDSAIFAAYIAIPLVLAVYIRRATSIPFPRILWLFVAFILACGFGHLLEAVIFWQPVYRLAGVVKLVTAIVSWATVVALIYVAPKVIKVPGLAAANSNLSLANAELQQLMDRLRDRTEKLEVEVHERRRAEEQLAEHAHELEVFNQLAVGRELRMVELKSEVNELSSLLGRPEKYDVEHLVEQPSS